MKTLLLLIRWFVGLLFIFSGLVKANDPLGLSYKMQEFFEVWGLHMLNDFTIAFSIVMIAFEIIAGAAVLLGWKMRLFSWLLLVLIIFFTFLTGYAVLSGKIRACGCFGDCIPLTATQSFIKDLLLLALILVVFRYRNHIIPAFKQSRSISVLMAVTVFSFALQWYVLRHLPVVDCLPYKRDNNILAKMKAPEGSVPDSIDIQFVYNKAGKEVKFSGSAFPDDFDDSVYKFVRREEKLIRKGNAEPPIKDFSLTTASGNDTTEALLSADKQILLLFVKDKFPAHGSWDKHFADILQKAVAKNISTFIVTNASDETLRKQSDFAFPGAGILKCDAVAIKTAARANPTLYLIRNGVIVKKWAGIDFDLAVKELEKTGR